MAEPDFHVNFSQNRVSVCLNVSDRSPKTRFYACIFFVGIWVLAVCGLLFLPGKHGNPSMWHDLSSPKADSRDFVVAFLILLGGSALMVLLSWRYVVSAYPSDESFCCDGSTLTISKMRWLDIRNKNWDTHSYGLAEITDIRYRAIATARGTSIYGLRFMAKGRTQMVLPGLKPSDADKILRALKAFGADVPDDPTLSKKMAEDASCLRF